MRIERHGVGVDRIPADRPEEDGTIHSPQPWDWEGYEESFLLYILVLGSAVHAINK